MTSKQIGRKSVGLFNVQAVEAPPEFIEEEVHVDVVAGDGRCFACQREGRPNDCGGYVKPKSGHMCANPKCGHSWTEHA
jgi:hypothetical protein